MEISDVKKMKDMEDEWSPYKKIVAGLTFKNRAYFNPACISSTGGRGYFKFSVMNIGKQL